MAKVEHSEKCKTCWVYRRVRRTDIVWISIWVTICSTSIVTGSVAGGLMGFIAGALLCVPLSFLVGFVSLDSSIDTISHLNWNCDSCVYNETDEYRFLPCGVIDNYGATHLEAYHRRGRDDILF